MRPDLEAIAAGTEQLRAVRYLPDEAFDDVTTEELVAAARWLRAASYSAAEGARRIERLITKRTKETTP